MKLYESTKQSDIIVANCFFSAYLLANQSLYKTGKKNDSLGYQMMVCIFDLCIYAKKYYIYVKWVAWEQKISKIKTKDKQHNPIKNINKLYGLGSCGRLSWVENWYM